MTQPRHRMNIKQMAKVYREKVICIIMRNFAEKLIFHANDSQKANGN